MPKNNNSTNYKRLSKIDYSGFFSDPYTIHSIHTLQDQKRETPPNYTGQIRQTLILNSIEQTTKPDLLIIKQEKTKNNKLLWSLKEIF
ncbi:hypothetical protein MQE36_01410 [Zhouia spongiae]|uniref:Uncharacterized protein n=1 Tax=Zhouia spongiae TaxID=2202721 RepID=A0ABY3YNF0_9FLAO|nr:hypothetical protein [Zhouia spongiae]UNY99021.1 hypothetical protein MQE36_01410 [Zhouia spongiae]